MDGNRRWAKRSGQQTIAGHQSGYSTLVQILEYCKEFGVETVTVYAFSIENFKRSQVRPPFSPASCCFTLSPPPAPSPPAHHPPSSTRSWKASVSRSRLSVHYLSTVGTCAVASTIRPAREGSARGCRGQKHGRKQNKYVGTGHLIHCRARRTRSTR